MSEKHLWRRYCGEEDVQGGNGASLLCLNVLIYMVNTFTRPERKWKHVLNTCYHNGFMTRKTFQGIVSVLVPLRSRRMHFLPNLPLWWSNLYVHTLGTLEKTVKFTTVCRKHCSATELPTNCRYKNPELVRSWFFYRHWKTYGISGILKLQTKPSSIPQGITYA